MLEKPWPLSQARFEVQADEQDCVSDFTTFREVAIHFKAENTVALFNIAES